MLIGEFKNSLGAKNRVAIPKRMREELTGKLYLSRGSESSLILMDEARFETLVDTATSFEFFSRKRRNYTRYYLGGSVNIDPDSQGRFVIPESLLEFAGITENIVFVGAYDWIELWDEQRWKNSLDALKKRYGS